MDGQDTAIETNGSLASRLGSSNESYSSDVVVGHSKLAGITTAGGDDADAEEEVEVEVTWSLDNSGITGKKRTRDDANDDDNDNDDQLPVVAEYNSEDDEDDEARENDGNNPQAVVDLTLDEDIDVSSNLPGRGIATTDDNNATDGFSSKQLHHRFSTSSSNTNFTDDAQRQRVLDLLKTLFSHLKLMGWVEEIELRKFARVPIICLVHKNGLQCDVSVGVKTGDTSRQVAAMQHMSKHFDVSKNGVGKASLSIQSTNAFYQLCAFLKLFMAGLGLDKPYTGGIGSYKLYVMIAFVIDKELGKSQQQSSSSSSSSSSTLRKVVVGDGQDFQTSSDSASNGNTKLLDLGSLLVTFFRYFGEQRHLNIDTVLRLRTNLPVNTASSSSSSSSSYSSSSSSSNGSVAVEATFAGTTQIRACQRAFQAAGNTLLQDLNSCQGNVRSLSWLSQATSEGDAPKKGFVFSAPGATKDMSRYSRSFLGRLVDTEKLVGERNSHSNRCISYPPLDSAERDDVASSLLDELNSRLQNKAREVSLSELDRTDPALACRLRSFRSVNEALRPQNHRQNHSGGGGGGGGGGKSGYGQHSRQVIDLTGSGSKSSSGKKRKVESTSNGKSPQYPRGVVGSAIAALANGRNSKKQKHNHNSSGGGSKKRPRIAEYGNSSGSSNSSINRRGGKSKARN